SADVIKIEVMSAYSCRNAYGRAGGRLSEHGLANALDIRGFITSAGKTAYVLESWGDTARDAARRLAAAKAAEEKKAREAAAAAARAAPPVAGAPAKPGTDSSTGSIAAKPARGKDGAGEPALALEEPATAATPTKTKPALSITLRPGQSEDGVAGTNTGIDIGISRLGGPKATTLARASDKPAVGSAASKPSGPPRITQFLRETHAAACRIFGTTLGPEANEAHRNHFHVDMAPRKSTKICD
ncbi:MAG: extensin family protein, partial [Hyphomicrobium sp.]